MHRIGVPLQFSLHQVQLIGINMQLISIIGRVVNFAGSASAGGLADGIGAAANCQSPVGMALDSTTNTLYFADSGNKVVRTVDPYGKVSTLRYIYHFCRSKMLILYLQYFRNKS